MRSAKRGAEAGRVLCRFPNRLKRYTLKTAVTEINEVKMLVETYNSYARQRKGIYEV